MTLIFNNDFLFRGIRSFTRIRIHIYLLLHLDDTIRCLKQIIHPCLKRTYGTCVYIASALSYRVIYINNPTTMYEHDNVGLKEVRLISSSFMIKRSMYLMIIYTVVMSQDYENVSVLIKFSQKTSLFTLIIISSP